MAEAKTYLSKCISQKRSIYSNRTVSYMIVLLELLTVLLEYIDLFVIAILISKNSYYYTNILPIMLALRSMLSGTYYAHNYASIIGGSLLHIYSRLTSLTTYLPKAVNYISLAEEFLDRFDWLLVYITHSHLRKDHRMMIYTGKSLI